MTKLKNTREIIDGLPEVIRRQVEYFRFSYAHPTRYIEKEQTRNAMAGYVLGLHDCGFITERERQVIFIYMTVPKKDEN